MLRFKNWDGFTECVRVDGEYYIIGDSLPLSHFVINKQDDRFNYINDNGKIVKIPIDKKYENRYNYSPVIDTETNEVQAYIWVHGREALYRNRKAIRDDI